MIEHGIEVEHRTAVVILQQHAAERLPAESRAVEIDVVGRDPPRRAVTVRDDIARDRVQRDWVPEHARVVEREGLLRNRQQQRLLVAREVRVEMRDARRSRSRDDREIAQACVDPVVVDIRPMAIGALDATLGLGEVEPAPQRRRWPVTQHRERAGGSGRNRPRREIERGRRGVTPPPDRDPSRLAAGGAGVESGDIHRPAIARALPAGDERKPVEVDARQYRGAVIGRHGRRGGEHRIRKIDAKAHIVDVAAIEAAPELHAALRIDRAHRHRRVVAEQRRKVDVGATGVDFTTPFRRIELGHHVNRWRARPGPADAPEHAHPLALVQDPQQRRIQADVDAVRGIGNVDREVGEDHRAKRTQGGGRSRSTGVGQVEATQVPRTVAGPIEVEPDTTDPELAERAPALQRREQVECELGTVEFKWRRTDPHVVQLQQRTTRHPVGVEAPERNGLADPLRQLCRDPLRMVDHPRQRQLDDAGDDAEDDDRGGSESEQDPARAPQVAAPSGHGRPPATWRFPPARE
ncbi:MAG: hypothetical protein U1F23_01845 [Lysobacterales bacterium]